MRSTISPVKHGRALWFTIVHSNLPAPSGSGYEYIYKLRVRLRSVDHDAGLGQYAMYELTVVMTFLPGILRD